MPRAGLPEAMVGRPSPVKFQRIPPPAPLAAPAAAKAGKAVAGGVLQVKGVALTGLLVAMAMVGPMVAYAGVSVIWPSSQVTVDVDESPPINFTAGSDHAQAQSLGFAGAFSQGNNGASFTLTLNGLSGGTVTVDNLTFIQREASVSSYKIQVATAIGGGINPTTLKARLWTGGTAPTADGDAQVCAVLDLEAAANTESSASCTAAGVKVQLVYALPAGQTTQSDSVSIRPSSIVFA